MDLTADLTNVLIHYYSIFPMTLTLPDSLHADESSMFYRMDVIHE